MENHEDWKRRLPVPVASCRAVAVWEAPERIESAAPTAESAAVPACVPANPSSRALVPLPGQKAAAQAFAEADRAYRRTMGDEVPANTFDVTV